MLLFWGALAFLVADISATQDWSTGCFQVNKTDFYKYESAGYYNPKNSTAETCVAACSSVKKSFQYAALTANDVCLCNKQSINVSQSVQKHLCTFPSPKALYVMVYPIRRGSISAPKSILTAECVVFQVNFTASPNCTYLVDFDNGAQQTLTSEEKTNCTKYFNAGSYNIKLSSKPYCLAKTVIKRIIVTRKHYTDVPYISLQCPDIIEFNGRNESCELLAGFGEKMKVDIKFNDNSPVSFLLADTITELSSSCPPPCNNYQPSVHQHNGTVIVIPMMKQRGFISEIYLSKPAAGDIDVVLQIFRPKCGTNKKFCFGRCTNEISSCFPLSYTSQIEDWLKHNLTTTVNYQVTFEKMLTFKTDVINFDKADPIEVYIGDMIGFHSNDKINFINPSSKIMLNYVNKRFNIGEMATTIGLTKTQNIPLYYIAIDTLSTMITTLTPSLPKIEVNVKVTHLGKSNADLKEIRVQERVSGLTLFTPRRLTLPSEKMIEFVWNITTGSEVVYSCDFGDGTDNISGLTPSSCSHLYRNKGNYTFTVVAKNLINTVNTSHNVVIMDDIKDLQFIVSPSNRPGIVNVPYNISFHVVMVDGSCLSLDYGDSTAFITCCDTISGQRTFTFNKTYNRPGDYVMRVVVRSDRFDTVLRISSKLFIQERVANLSVGEVTEQQTINPFKRDQNMYHSITKPLTLQLTVLNGTNVTFGITSTPPIMEYTMTSKSGQTGQAHLHFNNPGLYNITVIASNKISEISLTFSLSIYEHCLTVVSLQDHRSETNPFYTTRKEDLLFKLDIRREGTNCMASTDCCFFKWSYFVRKTSGLYELLRGEESRKDIFQITKEELTNGFYKIEVDIKANEESCTTCKEGFYQSFFEINIPAPVAVITGGQQRDVNYVEDGKIIVNASSSYDPDMTYFEPDGLQFHWITNGTVIGPSNSSTIELTMKNVMVNDVILLTVNVTKSHYNKTSVAKQRIRVLPPGAPVTQIICKVNCFQTVSRSDRLSLEGQCKNCKENVNFEWKLFELDNNNEWRNVSHIFRHHTFTGWNKNNFVLKAINCLRSGAFYELHLEAFVDDGMRTFSKYAFETSTKPKSGSCVINPSHGTSFTTQFVVTCEGWHTKFYPISFHVLYRSNFRPDATVSSISQQNDRRWLLWYYGHHHRTPPSTFPSGEKATNYEVPVIVEVHERYGEHTRFNLTVKVKPSADVTSLVSKFEAELESIDPVKNLQKYTQIVTKISSTLTNVDETRAKEMRYKMMIGLMKTKPKNMLQIKQVADAVYLAAYDETQVPHKTQEAAVVTLSKMVSIFREISSHNNKRQGQVIDETARILASSLSTIMRSTLYTSKLTTTSNAPIDYQKNIYGTRSLLGQQLEKIGDETKVIVNNLVETLDDMNMAVLFTKLNGEEPTLISSRNFKMELINSRAKHLNEAINGSFILPSNLFEEDNLVCTQVVSMENNPFRSDIEKTYFIQPNVRALSFTTKQGEAILVNNLNTSIEVFLPNVLPDIEHTAMKIADENLTKLHTYGFQVPKIVHNETILLDFKCTSRKLHDLCQATLLINFGYAVSNRNFTYNQTIFNSCSTNSISVLLPIFEQELSRNFGRMTVGLSHKEMTSSDEDNALSCSVYGHMVACKFWNHSEWLGNGCKVGPKTTLDQTHCLCNHLTSFSSYIVKPNPLTKLSVEALQEGYVSLVAVLVLLLIYIIVLVWARRADRLCSTQMGVIALPENNPNNTHGYEVVVWTGMRRNAGTKSKITILLHGTTNDSQPRRLCSPDIAEFQRGSMYSFLLTTPNSLGTLYCLRVWHDNSQGSWFLSRIMVTDLETNERYFFICERWLAVDEDDGMVDRFVPVAYEEELVEFQHLFYTRAKENLADSHLWFSVLNRRPQSSFTRVQRLSCCFCILMMTMATNAMFYQAKSEPKPNSTNFIGSYSFTWDEVFIGIQSSLIIFPANLIILFIFRRIRAKPSKKEKICECYSDEGISRESVAISMKTTTTILEDNEERTKLIKDTPKRGSTLQKCVPSLPKTLPYYCLYMAWPLLLVLMLGSAAVVVLYGMEFGNGKSLQWLLSIVISVCEDIFFMQPLKVLAIALIFALVIRKPYEGEFETTERMKNGPDDYFRSPSSLSEDGFGNQFALTNTSSPPEQELIEKMREKRMKERKMLGLLREIFIHITFTVVISLVTYGHKDSSAILLFNTMKNLETNSSNVNNVPEFWNWTRSVLIPTAFPKEFYNSRKIPRYGFFDDRQNYLISRARFRLLRAKKDSCTIAKEFKNVIPTCTSKYELLDQDEKSYQEGWNNGSTSTSTSVPPWLFQQWRTLDGFPYWGRFTTYSGSGYTSELIPGDDNDKYTRYLEKQEWLNKETRAVFIELTVYNANVNLYSCVTLLFEFPCYGGAFVHKTIHPMRLNVYIGGFAFFIFTCEVIFLFFIAAYFYKAIKSIYHQHFVYFKQFWNLIDFFILTSSLVAIGVYLYRVGMTEEMMKRVSSLDGSFVNFQNISNWDEIFNCVVALVITLTTVKLTKLMRFNIRLSLFAKTLKRAVPSLAGFLFQFAVVFFAFTLFGVLVFGNNVDSYRDLPTAMITLARVVLGKNEFVDLPIVQPILGPLFFFTYIIIVVWILMNMFLTIVIDSYHEVQRECRGMSNEYEIFDFFMKYVRGWLGLSQGKQQEKISAFQRWEKAKMKIGATHEISRRKPSEVKQKTYKQTRNLMRKLENSVKSLDDKVNDLLIQTYLDESRKKEREMPRKCGQTEILVSIPEDDIDEVDFATNDKREDTEMKERLEQGTKKRNKKNKDDVKKTRKSRKKHQSSSKENKDLEVDKGLDEQELNNQSIKQSETKKIRKARKTTKERTDSEMTDLKNQERDETPTRKKAKVSNKVKTRRKVKKTDEDHNDVD